MKDIKKSQQVEDKREKEKQIVDLMIHLYCRKKHKTVEKHHGLCEECEKLRDYAAMRVDKCPFMETKTFCSNCRVHCYKPQMREEIRNVMRFAGPRMLFYHPIMAIRHVITSAKEKKRMGRKETYDQDETTQAVEGFGKIYCSQYFLAVDRTAVSDRSSVCGRKHDPAAI